MVSCDFNMAPEVFQDSGWCNCTKSELWVPDVLSMCTKSGVIDFLVVSIGLKQLDGPLAACVPTLETSYRLGMGYKHKSSLGDG